MQGDWQARGCAAELNGQEFKGARLRVELCWRVEG